MRKIKGLDSNNQVWVDYWQLDSFDSEAYDEYKYESESSTFNSYIYYKESMLWVFPSHAYFILRFWPFGF